MAVFRLDGEASQRAPLLIWGHGWGHTHRALLPLAESLRRVAPSALVDFPGFGESPIPPGPWGTEDYADAMAEWLAGLGTTRRVWIGHSFGSRVGLQLAARHPELVQGLFLIAAAGLPRQRSPPAAGLSASRAA
jgi:pimeloyl-ACP methyl ester carboxylesterase